jgi:hypothetical protein
MSDEDIQKVCAFACTTVIALHPSPKKPAFLTLVLAAEGQTLWQVREWYR